MSETEKYDLKGVRGAENFRELEEGLVLELVDGSLVRIVENAGNGAVVLATVVADEANPDTVGDEQMVLFNDVVRVVEEGHDD